MRKLNDFNEFLFENSKILLGFRLTDRLEKLLISIKDPISNSLIDVHMKTEPKEVTLVDYDDEDNNKFSYIVSNKLYDYINSKYSKDNIYYTQKVLNVLYTHSHDEVWKMFRTSSRIGAFVHKVFPGQYNEKQVEMFVNRIRAKRSEQFQRFKVVTGTDISKYYLDTNYDVRATENTSLGISCMRYDKCQKFMDFYIKNNVEMVILMSEDSEQEDKIVGRAILWTIKNIDGEIVNRKFMDRIYSISEANTENFKEFAKKNNWLYKNRQNRYPTESICDPVDNTCRGRRMITDDKYIKTKYYPYLDTMCFFYWKEGYLSNNHELVSDTSEQPYYLQNAYGSYTVGGMRYIEYYNELIPEEDLTWCSYGNDWRRDGDYVYFRDEYATHQWIQENNYKRSELMDCWLGEDDEPIFLKYYSDYVTRDYIDHYMTYSKYENEYYNSNDVVWSEYYDSYIVKRKSVRVLTSYTSTIDYRIRDDNSYIKYQEGDNPWDNIKLYDKDKFVNDFVLCITKYGSRICHKEWDKNKIFVHDGKYFYKMNVDDIKNYLIKNG